MNGVCAHYVNSSAHHVSYTWDSVAKKNKILMIFGNDAGWVIGSCPKWHRNWSPAEHYLPRTNCHNLWLNFCPFVHHLPAKLQPQTVFAALYECSKSDGSVCKEARRQPRALTHSVKNKKYEWHSRVWQMRRKDIRRDTLWCDSDVVSGQRQSSSWLTIAIAEFVGHCVALSISETKSKYMCSR